jgi:hypothetical protein
MIDTDHPGGANIDLPNPVEIPPTQDPLGIPVPLDVPPPDSEPPREHGGIVNDPVPDRANDLRGDPLLP